MGSGDLMALVAFKHVPASIAFPLLVGTCVATGTFFTFVIDGSEDPGLLFGGVVLAVAAVVTLAWGQSRPPREPARSHHTPGGSKAQADRSAAMVIPVDFDEANHTMLDATTTTTKAKAKAATGTARAPSSSSSSSSSSSPSSGMSQSKWAAVLIGVGAYNSFWGPLSTIGRVGMDPHAAVFLVVAGLPCLRPLPA